MIQNLSTRYGKFINGNAYDSAVPNYKLICDYCGKEVPRFGDFMEAVIYKKQNGWKSINTLGEWTDMCPECRKNNGE